MARQYQRDARGRFASTGGGGKRFTGTGPGSPARGRIGAYGNSARRVVASTVKGMKISDAKFVVRGTLNSLRNRLPGDLGVINKAQQAYVVSGRLKKISQVAAGRRARLSRVMREVGGVSKASYRRYRGYTR